MKTPFGYFLALCFGLVFGCAEKVKLDRDDQRFIAVYADVLTLQGSYATTPDSLKARFNKLDSLSAIFAAHRYSPREFSERFELYRTNPKRWQEVQLRTVQILEERRNLVIQEKQDSLYRQQLQKQMMQ
ncbi:MAG: hypothetical protein NZM05_05700 [Chloroherpetonaceae bacterium]|nr:hypothetical protein [Chloroherpetonaceae bacterium]